MRFRLALWIVNCSASQCFALSASATPRGRPFEWFSYPATAMSRRTSAQLQIGAAAPAIEDGQRQGGHEGPGATAGIEQAIQVGLAVPKLPVSAMRGKNAAGRADVGIAGTQLVFGGNDVRATDQQLKADRPAVQPEPSFHRRVPWWAAGRIGAYQQCQGVRLRGASLLAA